MSIIQALLLSVVEGLTEFLPVSSTGHLVLSATLLHIQETDFVKSFEIFIQLGAIVAVIILYWKRFLTDKSGWSSIASAFIPTAVVGLVLYKFIKNFLLGNPEITVISLFIGGIVMILLEFYFKRKKDTASEINSLNPFKAFFIGMAQSISVIPGVSRSAATILGAMYTGLNRVAAVEFSFLLAVPTLIAATGLDLVKSRFAFSPDEYLLLAVGFTGSFVTAIIAIKLFLNFVKNNTLIPFGIYRIIVAILYWFIVLNK